MFTSFRLKARKFIKNNKWKVILVIIAWTVLIVVNQMFLNQKNEVPVTTYTPFEPIIENGETTPEDMQDPIENKIAEYIQYCNEKEYEKAYYMISEACRKKIYPTIDSFKAYVNYVFSSKRLYTIQNFFEMFFY